MDRDSITRTGASAPGVERNTARAEGPTSPIVPDTEQGNPDGGQKARRMMANPRAGKASSDIPALKPYRGKPAERNFRRWRRRNHSKPGPRHCLTRPLVAPVRIRAGGGQQCPSLPRPLSSRVTLPIPADCEATVTGVTLIRDDIQGVARRTYSAGCVFAGECACVRRITRGPEK